MPRQTIKSTEDEELRELATAQNEHNTKGNAPEKMCYLQCRLPETPYFEIQKFFRSNGIRVNIGIRQCIEFIMKEVEDGNLTINTTGINKKRR